MSFEPGLYPDVPEAEYRGDPALSSSGARRLLEVSARQWKWERDHPPTTSTDYFDLGTAVHTLVLGTGAPLVDVGHKSWNTNAAKEARENCWVAGEVPLRSQDYAKAHAMADTVRGHRRAQELLADGEPELSLWHRDPDTGVMLRSRTDWARWIGDHTALITDLKTSPAPTPEAFCKSVARFGYHCQQAFYQDAFTAHGITTAFAFLVVPEEPPHDPYVVELVAAAVELGTRKNRRAINRYAECFAADHWPGHGDDIHQIDLPAWEYKREPPWAFREN